uniref:Protein kinase domain-containing protein n=1 Tax=Leersia perrieri TaxID=77586 RepID=A0A0D9X1F0_9ORYZ
MRSNCKAARKKEKKEARSMWGFLLSGCFGGGAAAAGKKQRKKQGKKAAPSRVQAPVPVATAAAAGKKQRKKQGKKAAPSRVQAPVPVATAAAAGKKKVRPRGGGGGLRRLSFTDLSGAGEQDLSVSLVGSNLHVFTVAELRDATRGFVSGNFLGEGGFGPVYKGLVGDGVKPGLKPQAIAVKLWDPEGAQGHKEWLVLILSTCPS